jgi:TetR/AcrR family transcriptional regulator, cholesterol catabolism regulator
MAGRPSRAAEQRRRVLEASVDIFSKRGYRATSMNEIAAEVGLSKPTLYHYFRNKEDILVQLYEDVMEQSVGSARAIMAAASDSYEGLRQLIAYRVRYTCENQAIHKVFFEEEDELPPELLRTVVEQRRQFEDVLKSAVKRHLTSTGQTLATSTTVYVNTCLGAANWVYKWYDPKGSETPAALGEQMATLLLQPLHSPAPVGTS